MLRSLLAVVLVLASFLTLAPQPAAAQGSLYPLTAVFQNATLAATSSIPSADINNFVKAYQSIQGIRNQAEADMAKAVEAEGLTVERFNEIVTSQSTEAPKAAVTPEDKKFDVAIGNIISIRQSAEATMESAIEKAGLTVERFNEILEQSDQDSDLYKRIGEQINAK